MFVALFVETSYVCSRFYLHDPPGQDNAFRLPASAPQEAIERERELANAEPEVNPVGCVVLLAVTVAIMAVMAEFVRLFVWLCALFIGVMVRALACREHRVRARAGEHPRRVRPPPAFHFLESHAHAARPRRWFGLVLLPLISFSADGTVAIVYFARALLQALLGSKPAPPPDSVAEAKAIGLSIQFTLFWLPFLVLLGWWTGRPLTFLFGASRATVAAEVGWLVGLAGWLTEWCACVCV